MGRKSVVVVVLFVILVVVVIIRDSNSVVEDVVIFFMMLVSCEFIYLDRFEDWSGKIKFYQRLKKDFILVNFIYYYVNVYIRK